MWSKEGGNICRRRGSSNGGGFSFFCVFCESLGPARPSLCIIYELRHILRLNICWFVKSTNMRSCPSPWHTSSADGKTLSHIYLMRTEDGDPNPCRATPSHRHSFSCSDGGQRKRERGVEGWTQGHSFPLRGDGFQEGPLCLFVLTCLYVLFHLKVLTTDPETETDRKTGRGRNNWAICQNGATMLTAAVCVCEYVNG